MTGCQLSNIPGLFAKTEYSPNRKSDKTGLRKIFEKRYSQAFIPPTLTRNKTAGVIRDGMQDLFLAPLKHHLTFEHYFQLFWKTKVKPSFALSSTVVFDFDTQNRNTLLPKDNLHVKRDEVPIIICEDVDVSDDALIPPKTSWPSFLANRTNKKRLVEYICQKLQNQPPSIQTTDKLYVSFEGNVFLTTSEV